MIVMVVRIYTFICVFIGTKFSFSQNKNAKSGQTYNKKNCFNMSSCVVGVTLHYNVILTLHMVIHWNSPSRNSNSLLLGLFSDNLTRRLSLVQANYVLDNDHLVLTQRPEYDVIMCLSVTKWVHLNWGDSGLVRLFKRVFKHLRPGGLFLLEPQPWESYVRRKKLTVRKRLYGLFVRN